MNNSEPIPLRDILFLSTKALGKIIVNVAKINQGVMTHKYELIDNEFRNYIIRFYPKNIDYVINYEPFLFGEARKKGALVPEVLYVSEKQEKYKYIIYRKLIGNSLFDRINSMSYNDINRLVKQIRYNMSLVHSVKMNNYGPLTESNNASFLSWPDFVIKNIEKEFVYLNVLNLPVKINYKIKEFVFDNIEIVYSYNCAPSFIWSDISLENIIVDKSNLSGFIDFDSVMSGDNYLEMGYLYAREGDSVFFKALYGNSNEKKADYIKIYFYCIFRLIRLSKYLSAPLPNGRPREDIRKVFPGFFEFANAL